MKFRENVLLNYMSMAPLALAFERSLECQIYQKLPFVPPILDLGCGDGLFAHILFAENIDTGIDPNHIELSRARQLGRYGELIRCTGDNIPKPDGCYNTVFSNSVLEHIPDLDPVFRELHRLLAPGGRLYITVPSTQFEYYTFMNQVLTMIGLDELANKYRSFCSRHIWRQFHYFTLDGWRAIATRHGFVVSDSFEYDPKAICLLNDLLFPLAGFSLLTRHLLGRWVLSSTLRHVVFYPLYPLALRILRNGSYSKQGGLVFLFLTKPEKV